MGSSQSLVQPVHLVTVQTDALEQVALSRDGALCATRTLGLGKLCCRRVSDGVPVLSANKAHTSVHAIAFWRDNVVTLQQSEGGSTIRLVLHCLADQSETDVELGSALFGGFCGTAIFVARDTLVVSSVRKLIVFDLQRRKLLSECKSQPSALQSRVAVCPEAAVLALCYHGASYGPLRDDSRVGLWKLSTESGILPDSLGQPRSHGDLYGDLDELPTPHQVIPFEGRVEAFTFNTDGNILATLYRDRFIANFFICVSSIATDAAIFRKSHVLRLSPCSNPFRHRAFDDDENSKDSDNLFMKFSRFTQGNVHRLIVSAAGHGIQAFDCACHGPGATLQHGGYLDGLGEAAQMAMEGATYAKHELAQQPLAHCGSSIFLLSFWSAEMPQSTCGTFAASRLFSPSSTDSGATSESCETPLSLKAVVQVGNPSILCDVRRYPLVLTLEEGTYVSEHRFSDFLGLHRALQLLKPSPAPAGEFPCSRFIYPSVAAIEKRRQSLEKYINTVCTSATCMRDRKSVV